MLPYIIRRCLLIIPNVIFLTALLFWGVSALLGSPAAMMLGEDASPEAIAEINATYGFNLPVYKQYLNWMWDALQGDFGRSFTTQQQVSEAILPRLPASLEIAGIAIILATLGATVLNSIPVARKVLGTFNTGLSVVGITVPNFMLGISLIYLLSVQLKWLPTSGWINLSDDVGGHIRHLIMPVVTLSAFYFGSFSLVYRAEYKVVFRQLFIKVARAKGLTETRVSFKHALPNSILPVITYIGLSMGQLTGGAVVTETVFSVPGIGRLFVDSITSHDFPVMLAIGMIIIVGVVIMNLLADILYTVINPQIRLN
jgi:peptide/nickel transport system permease protein